MSVITKIFVVLLVVLSLITSAGLIVFVNQTQNFKEQVKAANDAESAAKNDRNQLMAQVSASAAYASRVVTERDNLSTALAHAADAPNQMIATLNQDKTTLQSQLKRSGVELTDAQAVSAATLAQNKGVNEALTSERALNDQLVMKTSDLNVQVADLVKRVTVSDDKVREFGERLVVSQADSARMKQIISDHPGWSAKNTTDVTIASAPPINGIVRETTKDGGVLHATIGVGSDDEVKVGMQFSVIDREKSRFLGTLTIDSVDAKNASGRLEGPHVTDVRPGTEARTQL